MTFKENIDKSELGEYPVSGFRGEIVLVNNNKEFKKCIGMLNSATVLGFDTETKPSFSKGKNNRVALLQLSDGHRAFLFRMNEIGMPSKLADILSDASVLKVGVAIHDDIKALKTIRKFEARGFIELQDYVKEFGIVSSGLKKLSAIVLGFRISKRQQVSNWEADVLTDAQIQYAATDAWVCYEIYNKLNNNNLL
ncbi:MAG: 3'-5' exonuclease [Bacteroidales bacterium]|nr:3'-5' exonuclease [Bacteroidales bacterium]